MGGKPKQEDYKPSEAEKASAAVARAEKLFFNENYTYHWRYWIHRQSYLY